MMTDRFGGVSAAMAMANLAAVLGPCAHPGAVPVELLDDGDVVAWLCPACDTQLPAEWREAVRKAERRQQEAAAYDLVMAGFDPHDALETVGLIDGHAAQDCPKRVEVTRVTDAVPRYIHGNCAAKEA